MSIEIRNDDRDCLDEIIGQNCYVHLERMDEHYFCLIVEDGERRVMLNIGSGPKYKRRVLATVYADEPSPPLGQGVRSEYDVDSSAPPVEGMARAEVVRQGFATPAGATDQPSGLDALRELQQESQRMGLYDEPEAK